MIMMMKVIFCAQYGLGVSSEGEALWIAEVTFLQAECYIYLSVNYLGLRCVDDVMLLLDNVCDCNCIIWYLPKGGDALSLGR